MFAGRGPAVVIERDHDFGPRTIRVFWHCPTVIIQQLSHRDRWIISTGRQRGSRSRWVVCFIDRITALLAFVCTVVTFERNDNLDLSSRGRGWSAHQNCAEAEIAPQR